MSVNGVFILAVYAGDQLGYVRQCIESLKRQTIPIPIAVRCDGPVDSALKDYLANELARGGIKRLGERAYNKGFAYTLNELLEDARDMDVEYIFRMDADDIAVPSRVQEQISFMDAHQAYDALGSAITEFDNNSGNDLQTVNYPLASDDVISFMRKRSSFAHVSMCFRARFFQKAGLYDSNRLNEDYELWTRALTNGCVMGNLPASLVRVRVDKGFYARRRNFKRALEILLLKVKFTRAHSLSWDGYIYAICHFILFMSPSKVKEFVYKRFR